MVYDVAEAFERIESQLIESMIRNLKKHQIEEVSEGKRWEQWQVAQLKELQSFKQRNKQHFSKSFTKINEQIKKAIKVANETGMSDEEVNILRAIKNGFELKRHKKSIEGGFFELNDRQLNVLINAVTKDFEKVESSVLRFANDQYRQIIFNAQVFATTGAGTYQQAIDMATKDFLQRGINCVEYKNGARHNIVSYADMAVRTATKRAYLQGEGIKRKEWGITTVIVNKRHNACPLCLPFEGKVLIDDVWSGGKSTDGPYPLMSTAIAAGMYHPNCKDVHTTYFPGVSTPPNDKFTNHDLENVKERQVLENKANHAKRQRKKFERLANNSLDADNIKKYNLKEEEWAKNTIVTESDLNSFEREKGFKLNKVIETLDNEMYNYITTENAYTELQHLIGIELTDIERKTIYTDMPDRKKGYIATNNSFKINKALYTNDLSKIDDFDLQTISMLDDVISRSVIPKNIKGDRYYKEDILPILYGQNKHLENVSNVSELIDKINEEGATLNSLGFNSISVLPFKSLFSGMPIKFEIDIPKGTNGYLTDNLNESELILGRNTLFKIYAATKDNIFNKLILKVKVGD